MGRRVDLSKERSGLIIRNFSPCHVRFIKAIAEIEADKTGRVVGLSEMTAKIVTDCMRREGFMCD